MYNFVIFGHSLIHFSLFQISETISVSVGLAIVSEEQKGHSLKHKEPNILNRVEFHNRADQARFLIILPDSPLGTGLILRKGEIKNFSNLSNSTEFVEHGFDYSDDEEPGMSKKTRSKLILIILRLFQWLEF